MNLFEDNTQAEQAGGLIWLTNYLKALIEDSDEELGRIDVQLAINGVVAEMNDVRAKRESYEADRYVVNDYYADQDRWRIFHTRAGKFIEEHDTAVKANRRCHALNTLSARPA